MAKETPDAPSWRRRQFCVRDLCRRASVLAGMVAGQRWTLRRADGVGCPVTLCEAAGWLPFIRHEGAYWYPAAPWQLSITLTLRSCVLVVVMEELLWAETKRLQMLKFTVNLTNRDLIGCFCSSLSVSGQVIHSSSSLIRKDHWFVTTKTHSMSFN